MPKPFNLGPIKTGASSDEELDTFSFSTEGDAEQDKIVFDKKETPFEVSEEKSGKKNALYISHSLTKQDGKALFKAAEDAIKEKATSNDLLFNEFDTSKFNKDTPSHDFQFLMQAYL